MPNSSELVANSIEKVVNSIELNSSEKLIVEFLQKNEKIYSEDVEKLLNIKEAMARRVLQKLVKKGILEKIGKTKGSYYILKRQLNEQNSK
jgi:ATP-dependent DNA helicase RecG